MSRWTSFFLILALVLARPALSGDKTEKTLDVGAKGAEVKDEIKESDVKLKLELEDKVFLSPAKGYILKLAPNTRYRATMDTTDPKLDPFLVLKNKKGDIIATDDDGGGGLNAMLKFSLPEEGGPYQIFAASLHGTPGPFHLEITPQATVFWDPKVHEVDKELKINGELTAERQEIVYLMRFKGGKKYRIDLVSKAFDSFLELRDDLGKLIAEDDDKGGMLNARIIQRIAKDGTYRVVASSTNLKQTGAFTLEVRQEK